MAESMSTKVGHALARLLGIDLIPETYPALSDEVKSYAYIEPEPTAADWIRTHTPTILQVRRYLYNLFPFLHWIVYYNLQWLIGDLIAGTWKPKRPIVEANIESSRGDRRRSCYSSGNGIRRIGPAAARIWTVFILHGCPDLLVFCNFQGHHDWSKLVDPHCPS